MTFEPISSGQLEQKIAEALELADAAERHQVAAMLAHALDLAQNKVGTVAPSAK